MNKATILSERRAAMRRVALPPAPVLAALQPLVVAHHSERPDRVRSRPPIHLTRAE